jgi:hypothetical protein
MYGEMPLKVTKFFVDFFVGHKITIGLICLLTVTDTLRV